MPATLGHRQPPRSRRLCDRTQSSQQRFDEKRRPLAAGHLLDEIGQRGAVRNGDAFGDERRRSGSTFLPLGGRDRRGAL
jgi:hypothetical protein